MRRIIAFAALACALAAATAAPAGAQTVKLLANITHQGVTAPGNTAATGVTVGPFHTDAIVMISAQGLSHYAAGNGLNSGIVVGIVEDHVLVEDDSFEARSSSLMYRAAVSHSFLLKAGTTRAVRVRTLPYGAASAANTQTGIWFDLVALAVN